MTTLKTMLNNKTAVVIAMVILLVAVFATGAAALYEGAQAVGKSHQTSGTSISLIAGLPAISTANGGSAPGFAPGVPTSGNAIAQPYPGPGPFEPGLPPFGQAGATADGLSAWGVAFKETTDANAQADAALIKSAFQDAQKKADELASASGIKLGKLVAITDYTQAQPFYGGKLCPQPELGRPAGPPLGLAQPNGSTGSGSGTVAPAQPVAPVPAPCQAQRYVIAWVLVRYQIGS